MLGVTCDSETVSKSDSRSCSDPSCTKRLKDFVGLGRCVGRRESRARGTAAGLSERSERVAIGVIVILSVFCSFEESWSSDSGMSSRSRICRYRSTRVNAYWARLL